jgi:predicted CoA-binding protein
LRHARSPWSAPRDTSPGRAVLKNLRSGGYAGEIYLVNPHYDSIEGIAAVKSCNALPGTPDIVVIGRQRPCLRWCATPRRWARRRQSF